MPGVMVDWPAKAAEHTEFDTMGIWGERGEEGFSRFYLQVQKFSDLVDSTLANHTPA